MLLRQAVFSWTEAFCLGKVLLVGLQGLWTANTLISGVLTRFADAKVSEIPFGG